MEKTEVEVTLYGRVQGINFRRTIAYYAQERSLTGLAMNKDDGSVFLVAQGGERHLKELLGWISASPGMSSVRGMSYHWRSPSKDFKDFSIIKTEPFLQDQARSFIQLGRGLLSRSAAAVPRHIAIIPDGNRRWARSRGMDATLGHYTSSSVSHMFSLLKEAKSFGIRYVTFWSFSTENWKRSKREVAALMDIIFNSLSTLREQADALGICFRHLGRKDRLRKDLAKGLVSLEQETRKHDEMQVQLCLDYGGADEIVRAVNVLLAQGKSKVNEQQLMDAMDSVGLPPVDLVVRTSGEQRLSGFMPLLTAYCELYFSAVHFPDFGPEELRKAIITFRDRKRRFGS